MNLAITSALLTAMPQPPANPAPPAEQPTPPPPGDEISVGTPIPSTEPPSNERPVKKLPISFDKQTEVTITRDWDKPVLQPKRLGSMPSDYYQHAWGWPVPGYGYYPTTERRERCYDDSCNLGPVPVERDVPVYGADGAPQKQRITQTLTEKTHSQKASFFTGGGVGLALGAGVGIGVLAALGGLTGTTGVVTALLGGAVGAAAGAAVGYKAVDNDKIEEVWMQDDIQDPKMTGYTERVTPDVSHEQRCHTERGRDGSTRQECETWSTLRGYDHDFYPNLTWTKVGDFTYPTLQHTSKMGPVAAGFLAAGAGAGAGVLGALAVKFLPMLL